MRLSPPLFRALYCLLVVALAVSACADFAAADSATGDREISAKSVDGWRIGVDPDPTYLEALQRFGPLRPPTVYAKIQYESCLFTSRPLGLRLDFGPLLPVAHVTPRDCSFFNEAYVWGQGWHTPNGLRVGATLKSLRALYPEAYKGFEGVTKGVLRIPGLPIRESEWVLTRMQGHGRQPLLVARVADERVVALGVAIFGH